MSIIKFNVYLDQSRFQIQSHLFDIPIKKRIKTFILFQSKYPSYQAMT